MVSAYGLFWAPSQSSSKLSRCVKGAVPDLMLDVLVAILTDRLSTQNSSSAPVFVAFVKTQHGGISQDKNIYIRKFLAYQVGPVLNKSFLHVCQTTCAANSITGPTVAQMSATMPPQQLPRITLTPPSPGSTCTLFPGTLESGDRSLEKDHVLWHLGFNHTAPQAPFVVLLPYPSYTYDRFSNDDGLMVLSKTSEGSRFPSNNLPVVKEEKENDEAEKEEDRQMEMEEDVEEDVAMMADVRRQIQQRTIGPACGNAPSVPFRRRINSVRESKRPRRRTMCCIPPWLYSVFSRQGSNGPGKRERLSTSFV